MTDEKLGRIFSIIKSEICNGCTDASSAFEYLVNNKIIKLEEHMEILYFLQCLNFHGIREVAHYRNVF